MNDLKRCPFCGTAPVTQVEVTQMGGNEDIIDFSVKCPQCGIRKTMRLKIKQTACFLDAEVAMQKVISAWNMRKYENW